MTSWWEGLEALAPTEGIAAQQRKGNLPLVRRSLGFFIKMTSHQEVIFIKKPSAELSENDGQ